MAFNIKSLATKDTFKLHLKHPVTGERLYDNDDVNKPICINLYGRSSKQHRNAVAEMQRKYRGKKQEQISPEAMREESSKLLAACTDSVENLEYEGKAVTGTVVFDMYNDVTLEWLKDQVDSELGDISNFLEASKVV